MARRFVRIDLSDTARDFRPVAVEPGVPLLDKSNGNAKILFKWLGGLVGEPEWDGESVGFYVRDDHGGRLEDITCSLVGEEDLKGPLKADVEAIKQRLAKAKPETSTERAIHKIITASFLDLAENPNRTDRDNYFFRYRDVQGRWRLVWCWGYQRVDQQPAPTVVCTDPECNLLFVRRPGQSMKCPSCEANLATHPAEPRSRKRGMLVGLLLFLLGAALVYWLLTRDQLVATPDRWTGPVGSRVAFQVRTPGFLGLGRRDVTRDVVAVSADPRIARLDRFEPIAVAGNPGKTLVRFYLGKSCSSATLTVSPAQNPAKIVLEPDNVELGVGTTARLKVMGEYENGNRLDLTDAAEWPAKNDGVVFACDGLLEGLAPGTSSVTARYRANPESEYLEAAANVSVAKIDFKSLELAIEPLPVRLGRGSKLAIDALSAEGKKYSVLESSRLKTAVDPADLATAYARHLEGRHPGHGKLSAEFTGQISASAEFDVTPGLVDRLVVSPEQFDMIVGEIVDLTILSPSGEPIEVTSSSPAVVEVAKGNRLIGRAQGVAKIEVSQAGQTGKVEVTVAPGAIESISVRPMRVVVPVADTRAARVMARTEGDRRVELAPDMVKCEKSPSPKYAALDANSLELQGVRATEAGKPEQLAVSFQKHRADAPVEVVPGPLTPALAESGPKPAEVRIVSDQGPSVRFPVGAEFDDFRVEVRYPDGMTRMVTKKATFSTPQSADKALVGFTGGRLVGVRPGQTTVSAEYEGVAAKTPLEVQVTAEVDADLIRLAPTPAKILPGETIGLEATGYKNNKSIGLLTRIGGLSWNSDNRQVLGVKGPSVTGRQLGKGNVTAKLGALVSKPAQVSVVHSIADGLVVQGADGKKLGVLEMRVGETLRVGADFAIFRGNVDLSPECEVTPARSDIVKYDPATRALHGLAPGETPVSFAVADKLATAVVRVLPAGSLQGQLVVEPATGVFSPGQAMDLRVFLINKEGERIDVTDSAKFASSAPETVAVQANRACAMAPGTAEVTASLPGAEAARAALTVDNEEIVELIPEPSQVQMSVGDIAGLRVAGRSASGTRELFPQPKLQLSIAGQDPQAIRLIGSKAIEALAAGSAEVKVDWQEKLGQQVPVIVTKDLLTDLRIEPSEAAIHPGQGLVYQVTGLRGGQRRVLGPEDGVKLSTADAAVAQVVGDLGVEARNLGRTDVVAQLGGQQAKAGLNVVAGVGAPTVVTGYPQGVVVTGPGGGWFDGGGGYHVWHGGGGRVVVGPDGVVGTDVVGVGPGLVQPSDTVWIEPRRASVKVGETTPQFNVLVQGADGAQRVVSAVPQSMDETILIPESQDSGRFMARSLGRTQVRARVADREVFADVTVTGERFASVNTSIADPTDKDFAVAADIVAADPDTPLEYRAYVAGEDPPPNWAPSRQQGGSRRVTLQSPRIKTGPKSAFYNLMFEARDPTDGSIQKYPYTFQLGITIEEVTEAPRTPQAPARPDAPPGGPAKKADSAEEKPADMEEKPAAPEEKGAKPMEEPANPFDVPPETPPTGKPAGKPRTKPAGRLRLSSNTIAQIVAKPQAADAGCEAASGGRWSCRQAAHEPRVPNIETPLRRYWFHGISRRT